MQIIAVEIRVQTVHFDIAPLGQFVVISFSYILNTQSLGLFFFSLPFIAEQFVGSVILDGSN